jgi:NADH dehydrogenase/NADH:ubiquinone oxidoreductase subunit G
VSALKELGFDYVFDTNFAADVTIMEEGYEFIRRLQSNDNLPMFTSCCPGWVNLVEKSYPELMPHLSTCKSPQGMMGTLVKTYFAQKLGVNPDRIVRIPASSGLVQSRSSAAHSRVGRATGDGLDHAVRGEEGRDRAPAAVDGNRGQQG